jgi:hypothetical protein
MNGHFWVCPECGLFPRSRDIQPCRLRATGQPWRFTPETPDASIPVLARAFAGSCDACFSRSAFALAPMLPPEGWRLEGALGANQVLRFRLDGGQ